MPSIVHVVYCGAWGYGSKFRAIQNAILSQHPDAKITGEATPTATGYLEVTVDGTLVHSKDNGDGYVDTAEKMEKILDAVRKGS